MSRSIKSISDLKIYYQQQKTAPCLEIYNDHQGLLKQIILIRHGEPDIERKGWYGRSEAVAYAKKYDEVGIKHFSNPLCVEKLKDIRVFHSTMPRAVHTAKLIFGAMPMTPDARFREFPKNIIPFFKFHLPLGFWNGLSRLVWYLGLNSKSIEGVRQARWRTFENALYLSAQAQQSNTIAIVAHGFHNRYVVKYLIKVGWQMVRKGGVGHLAINILARK